MAGASFGSPAPVLARCVAAKARAKRRAARDAALLR